MATITGSSLKFTSAFTDDAFTVVSSPETFASQTINSVTYVYAASQLDAAIQIFTLGDDGILNPFGQILDTATTSLDTIWDLETFTINGFPYLAAAGEFSDGLTVYSLSDSVPPAFFVNSVFDSDNASFELDGPVEIEVVQFGSRTFIYTSAFSDNGLSAFEMGIGGTLTSVQQIDGSVSPSLGGALGLEQFTFNGSTYVAATSALDDALTIFRVNSSTGQLSFVIDTNTGLDRPWGVTAVEIDQRIYLYVANDFGPSLQVFRLENNLGLTEVQTIELPSSFADVRDVHTYEVGDQTFMYVGGSSSDSFVVYEVDTNPLTGHAGRLSFAENKLDSTGEGALDTVRDGHVATVGSQQFLLVASKTDSAVNVYEVGGGDDVLEGTALGDTIDGRGGDDILYAFAGNDFVDGGAGDDVIFAGSGADYLLLSRGEDSLYGGSDVDTLSALEIVLSNGVTIDFIRNEIFLDDGTKQFVTGVENIEGTQFGDTLVGTDGVNALFGLGGADIIRAREGNDEIYGGNGDDRLFGAGGIDEISGGDGNDLLNGGAGDDTLFGEADNDRLFAGDGNDTLWGGDGDDLLKGNDGDDILRGGDDNDQLEGQSGNDFLDGGRGNDVLIGGGGRDYFLAGSGDDILTGGSAIDRFEFETVSRGGGGTNRITDFQDGLDLIKVDDYNFFAPQEVLALAVQDGTDVRITFADTQVVLLENFALGDLDASDFLIL